MVERWRTRWWLASTEAMLGALYVSSPSPVLALMLTAALVPAVCCSAPAAANSPSSNAAGWAGGYFPAGDKPPRRPRNGAANPGLSVEAGKPVE